MKSLLVQGVILFNEFVLIYFVALNSTYLFLFFVSLREVLKFVKRTFFTDYQHILMSDLTWPISILVPAHNEERTIADTVRSLQMLNYGEFEIVVINDGSTDRTLRSLIDAFELRKLDKVYRRSIPSKEIRGLYGSLTIPNLLVIDKEKGGKADALNAGINAARYPLFCSVDADSIIEENALRYSTTWKIGIDRSGRRIFVTRPSCTSQPLAILTMPPTATASSGCSMKGLTTRSRAFSSMMESASTEQNSG